MNTRFPIGLGLAIACSALSVSALAEGSAQCTLENRIDRTLDLYVNSNYACRALAGLTRTAQISAGEQVWEARSGDEVLMTRNVNVEDGASPVWTVCYVDQNTGKCPGE